MLLYRPPHHKAFMEDLIAEKHNLSDLYAKDDHDCDDDLLDGLLIQIMTEVSILGCYNALEHCVITM